MRPDRVSNPGPLAHESNAPLTAPRGPALGIQAQIKGSILTYRPKRLYVDLHTKTKALPKLTDPQ